MGMYGALVAVPADRPPALEEVRSLLLEAAGAYDQRTERQLPLDKSWMWVGRALQTALPDHDVPFGHTQMVYAPGLSEQAQLAMSAASSPDELLALVADHPELEAVLMATEYGPALMLPPDTVQTLAGALAGVDDAAMRAAAEVAASDQGAYPVGGEDGLVDEILSVTSATASFIGAAAERGDAIVYGIS